GLASRKPMHIVSLDGLRIASSEQLRTIATILGCSFQLLDKPDSLAGVIEEQRQRSWMWIDTPGAGPHEEDIIEEFASVLRKQAALEVYLVLSASMKSA